MNFQALNEKTEHVFFFFFVWTNKRKNTHSRNIDKKQQKCRMQSIWCGDRVHIVKLLYVYYVAVNIMQMTKHAQNILANSFEMRIHLPVYKYWSSSACVWVSVYITPFVSPLIENLNEYWFWAGPCCSKWTLFMLTFLARFREFSKKHLNLCEIFGFFLNFWCNPNFCDNFHPKPGLWCIHFVQASILMALTLLPDYLAVSF